MIRPGATIGILGDGQLGRMLAMDARRLGYRVAVMGDDRRGPAAQVADEHHEAPLDDVQAAATLASRSAVVTIETEHVALPVLEAVAALRPCFPPPRTLAVVHDRLAQKRWLEGLGLPQPRFAPVDASCPPAAAAAMVGTPAVMKTRRGGYDGRGQARVPSADEAGAAWHRLERAPAVLESFVSFDKEISVVLARAADGTEAVYPVVENVHRAHVLHTSRVPADVPPTMAEEAIGIGRSIARALDYVGVLAVEMFVTTEGRLLVNEIAPRVHNSGHFSQAACATSQFEQHLRAICGLPLGSPALLCPAVMVNLLGDLWTSGEPDWGEILRAPSAQLHLYGKTVVRPGRKMGHVILLDSDTSRALRAAERITGAQVAT